MVQLISNLLALIVSDLGVGSHAMSTLLMTLVEVSDLGVGFHSKSTLQPQGKLAYLHSDE